VLAADIVIILHLTHALGALSTLALAGCYILHWEPAYVARLASASAFAGAGHLASGMLDVTPTVETSTRVDSGAGFAVASESRIARADANSRSRIVTTGVLRAD
jgi:hypothetical protein